MDTQEAIESVRIYGGGVGGGTRIKRVSVKADTHEGLHLHFARVSTHKGAFSNSLNLPRELAPKYLTG